MHLPESRFPHHASLRLLVLPQHGVVGRPHLCQTSKKTLCEASSPPATLLNLSQRPQPQIFNSRISPESVLVSHQHLPLSYLCSVEPLMNPMQQLGSHQSACLTVLLITALVNMQGLDSAALLEQRCRGKFWPCGFFSREYILVNRTSKCWYLLLNIEEVRAISIVLTGLQVHHRAHVIFSIDGMHISKISLPSNFSWHHVKSVV